MARRNHSAQSRGADAPRKEPERVSSVLKSAFRQYGIDEQLARYQFVLEWSEVVGPEIAKRSRPESLEHGVLTVRVSSSSWAQELSFQKAVILHRLRKHCGSSELIEDVRFYVDGSGKG